MNAEELEFRLRFAEEEKIETERNAYFQGIEDGRARAIDEYRTLLKDYFVIPHDLRVIDMYAKQLKEQSK